MPALDLAALQSARGMPPMSDEDMVAFLRANLLDPAAPNPSLETLLHAFLPAKFVDHSHASAALVLANQPDAVQIDHHLFGGRLQQAIAESPDGWANAGIDFRTSHLIRDILDNPSHVQAVQRGTVTPDHVIRLKPFPLVLRADALLADMHAALSDFASRYRLYFDQGAAHASEQKIMLDPLPRLVLVPGMGIFGIGKSDSDARIVADLAKQMLRVVSAAERYGSFTPLAPLHLFEMENWSLEQAKLKKG